MQRRSAVVFACVAVAGCGGSSTSNDGGTNAAVAACYAIVQAQCNAAFACETTDSASACYTNFSATCPQENCSGGTFSQANANSCISQSTSQSCADYQNSVEPAICLDVCELAP